MEATRSPPPSKKSRTVMSGHQFDNDHFCASNQTALVSTEIASGALNNRVWPSIGAYAFQCARCFKWRLVPTKEKYEEIREHSLQDPFERERAREWRPSIRCSDQEDISQDGSRLWAIDKPNIARAPPGWERQVRIRGEGGTKFADVYYTSPTGRKLRSLVEVDKYLLENPEYIAQGVTLTQFSFQSPRPLRQDYVKKRPKLASPSDEVNPISWATPIHEGQEEVELIRKRKLGSS